MSSILKALKKLEHDKAVRKPDSFRIDAEILQGRPDRRLSSRGVFLAAVFTFACGVGATYLYMTHDKATVADQPVQAPKSESKVEQPSGTEARPLFPGLVTPSAGQQEAQTRLSPASSTTVKGVVEKPATPQRQVDRSEQTQRAKPSEAIPVHPQIVSPPEPLPAPPATPVTRPRPALKVSGIAFQDGSSESVAVINGITVSSGSVVEGARVEEIQKDRVKFSRDGEKFDVILDKSN